jgi:hypothetical protein
MDELSLGELVTVLTLGQDSSFGQPLESQMRSTLLAIWLAASARPCLRGTAGHRTET